MRDLTAELERWLEAGGERVGQVLIRRADGGWELCHVDDSGRADLRMESGPEAARAIANLDAAGAFRPLKTAPNLARGWRLVLRDTAELRMALDALYPAMLGVRDSWRRGELRPVPLRETLGRQTGMYRVTAKISDAQARGMIDGFCSGCMKHRLWEIAALNSQAPDFAPPELPLLCHEACNLLVAEARKVVKSEGAAS